MDGEKGQTMCGRIRCGRMISRVSGPESRERSFENDLNNSWSVCRGVVTGRSFGIFEGPRGPPGPRGVLLFRFFL